MIATIKTVGRTMLIIAALGVVAAMGWKIGANFGEHGHLTTATAIGRPVIMRTPGGILEVATLNFTERIERIDSRIIAGLNLGETVSQIDVPATYRYQIELAPEWKMEIRGKTCFIISPPIRPSLPVAIETEQMHKRTQSGWARFNKRKNLAALEKEISSKLQEKASSEEYLQLVLEPARKTVSEFVSKWLIKEQQWSDDPEYQIKVAFANER